MLASRLHEKLPLARIVAAWLLDVDVFAGRAAEDGGGSMPVIAGGDDEDVDRARLLNSTCGGSDRHLRASLKSAPRFDPTRRGRCDRSRLADP